MPGVCDEIQFAVIGDYGSGGLAELAVANMIHNWDPDFVITVGDNNYPLGEAETIDPNVGQFYSQYIYPYSGDYSPPTISINRFFPTLGNHDWEKWYLPI